MTVFVGRVKEKAELLEALVAETGDIERAGTLAVAAIDKTLRELNEELDLRIGELDIEIAGDVATSAFGLPAALDPIVTLPQLGIELENVLQMTRLIDVRSYSGRIDRLMDQVR